MAKSRETETSNGETALEEQRVEPTVSAPKRLRRVRVLAGPCPQSPRHQDTRIHTTRGRKRYCVCDDCGHTWVKVGDYGDPLVAYLDRMIRDFDRLNHDVAEGVDVIRIRASDVSRITADLRKLMGQN